MGVMQPLAYGGVTLCYGPPSDPKNKKNV